MLGAMTAGHPKIDRFLDRAERWKPEMTQLRSILLGCGLDEQLKWGKPCYCIDGRNVAILQPFKEHCALMFFKGVLLEDRHGQLRSQGPNSQSARRLEFTGVADIKKSVVQSYVRQAIAVEKAGKEVARRAKDELDLPAELAQALARDPKLARAFEGLTPGRQRSWVIHITGAKQSATRARRVEQSIPRILAGKGRNDR